MDKNIKKNFPTYIISAVKDDVCSVPAMQLA